MGKGFSKKKTHSADKKTQGDHLARQRFANKDI